MLLKNVKIPHSSEDMTNPIFSFYNFFMGKLEVIFDDFFTIFQYKIFNIESAKIVTKMQTMGILPTKIIS